MPRKSSTRVLVVDDNRPHCYVMARMLETAGYTALQAHNGKEALDNAAERPDLVLLHVRLPDMDGVEVARRLRSHPVTANIPVVFMSPSEPGAAAKVQDAQVENSGFLTQPVEAAHLLAVVRDALSDKAGKR